MSVVVLICAAVCYVWLVSYVARCVLNDLHRDVFVGDDRWREFWRDEPK